MPEETETVNGNPAQEQSSEDHKDSSEANRNDEQNNQTATVQVSSENDSQPSVEACILKTNLTSETRSEPEGSSPIKENIPHESQQVWSVKTSLTPKSPEVVSTEAFLLHEQQPENLIHPPLKSEPSEPESKGILQKIEIPSAPVEVPEPVQVPEQVPQSVEPRTPANSEASEGGVPSGGEEPQDLVITQVLQEPRSTEPVVVAVVKEHNTVNGDISDATPKQHVKAEISQESITQHQLTNGQSYESNGECKLEPRKLQEPEPHAPEKAQVLIEAIANELKAEDYKLPDVIEVKKHFEYVEPAHNDVSAAPPKKGALSTRLDAQSVKQAYEDVRYDGSETQWAVFKFEGPTIVTSAIGSDFSQFQTHFGDDERAFGYIRVQTGDEMSKRAKFLFVTWVGPAVSVLKRAKMSTDKALMKGILSNFAVELQTENLSDINLQNFETELDKAAGAHYGTGVRDITTSGLLQAGPGVYHTPNRDKFVNEIKDLVNLTAN